MGEVNAWAEKVAIPTDGIGELNPNKTFFVETVLSTMEGSSYA
jgi:hypothetical protein